MSKFENLIVTNLYGCSVKYVPCSNGKHWLYKGKLYHNFNEGELWGFLQKNKEDILGFLSWRNHKISLFNHPILIIDPKSYLLLLNNNSVYKVNNYKEHTYIVFNPDPTINHVITPPKYVKYGGGQEEPRGKIPDNIDFGDKLGVSIPEVSGVIYRTEGLSEIRLEENTDRVIIGITFMHGKWVEYRYYNVLEQKWEERASLSGEK